MGGKACWCLPDNHGMTLALKNKTLNKTIATWLAFLGGPLGLHRLYLHGWFDWLAWLHPIPTALGLYGIERMQRLGQDDALSWVLIPLLGFTFAITALHAIVYGLMSREKWNAIFNAQASFSEEQASPGDTQWITIAGVVLALLIGTTVLSFQRYFEHQIAEARKISQ
jgi:hypothetical protein